MTSLRKTEDPTIEYVFDSETGQEFLASNMLPTDEREISQQRQQAFIEKAEGTPTLLCAACHCPVYPKRTQKVNERNGVTFSHFAGDSKDCEYSKPGSQRNMQVINAMRYNGLKEGDNHKDMKRFLRQSIEADKKHFPQNNIREEKNWYGNLDREKWRRPDIAATYHSKANNQLDIAFEVQLSTTFLSVVAERRQFYLKNNALLFWILKESNTLDPRQFEKDLFYNNNSNLFVVDQETLQLSIENKILTLKCRYLEPTLNGVEIIEAWREKLVTIDQLTIDQQNQQIFFFDYETEKNTLHEAVARVIQRRELKNIRENFATAVESKFRTGDEDLYDELVRILRKHGIDLPTFHTVQAFTALVYSAKDAEPIACRYRNFLEVANWGFKDRPGLFYYFYQVMSHFKNWQYLNALDDKAAQKRYKENRTGWREKQKLAYEQICSGTNGFKRDESVLDLFKLLFPEIGK